MRGLVDTLPDTAYSELPSSSSEFEEECLGGRLCLAQIVARWLKKDLGLNQVDQPPKRLYLAKPNFTMGVESSKPRMKATSWIRDRIVHDEEEMVVTVVEQIPS